jgi:cell wall-associated NlpC family hydrolase
MPRFTAEQIYAYARQAGFSPDQATTMTAIAMAESGGDSRSHATHGEDSQGLWQINALAHPDLAARFNLYDPAQNAQAAFIASHGGTDVSPWTTTHGGLSARYLRFKDEAQAAAAAYGDGPNHGVWTGTAGYGHPLSAGDPTGRGAAPATTEGSDAVNVGHGPTAALGTGTSTGATEPGHIPGSEYGIPLSDQDHIPGTEFGIPLAGAPAAAATSTTAFTPAGAGSAGGAHDDHLHTFLSSALAQNHDQYIFGVMDRLDDPNPKAFDCSMLVEWSAHQAGVDMPRNAWDQYRWLHDRGMVIPVDQAIHTPGALLFSFNSDPNGGHAPVHQHVAISLGDGKTIEALGTQYGVGSFDATTKRFQYAAVIPGISDHVGATGPLDMAADQPAADVGNWPDTAHAMAGFADATVPTDPGDGGLHFTDGAPAGTIQFGAATFGDPGTGFSAPPPAGGSPPPGGGNQFSDQLAFDPDQLDSGHPGGAPPPPDPHAGPHATHPPPDPHADPHAAQPAHEPLYFTLVDANGDGLDDSLEQAGNPPGGPPPVDDGTWYHDHGHGGGH